jgi:hypothetical protein
VLSFWAAPPVTPTPSTPPVMAREATTMIGTSHLRSRSPVLLAVTRACTSRWTRLDRSGLWCRAPPCILIETDPDSTIASVLPRSSSSPAGSEMDRGGHLWLCHGRRAQLRTGPKSRRPTVFLGCPSSPCGAVIVADCPTLPGLDEIRKARAKGEFSGRPPKAPCPPDG